MLEDYPAVKTERYKITVDWYTVVSPRVKTNGGAMLKIGS